MHRYPHHRSSTCPDLTSPTSRVCMCFFLFVLCERGTSTFAPTWQAKTPSSLLRSTFLMVSSAAFAPHPCLSTATQHLDCPIAPAGLTCHSFLLATSCYFLLLLATCSFFTSSCACGGACAVALHTEEFGLFYGPGDSVDFSIVYRADPRRHRPLQLLYKDSMQVCTRDAFALLLSNQPRTTASNDARTNTQLSQFTQPSSHSPSPCLRMFSLSPSLSLSLPPSLSPSPSCLLSFVFCT